MPPADLSCTGLYSDVGAKVLGPGIQPYAPAFSLWSDGATKQRWVYLPPGSKINAEDPDEWVYPVGTRFFKEFSVAGQRVETRLWQKVDDGYWVHATYAWNPDETVAQRHPGGDVDVNGVAYHIPTRNECEDCHKGRTDRILGFGVVSSGVVGATGVTLDTLVRDQRIFPTSFTGPYALEAVPPVLNGGAPPTSMTVAMKTFGWLHANCGISCHNENPRAIASRTGLHLRLRFEELDGRPLAATEAYARMVNQPVVTANWRGGLRVTPGNPDASWLYQLVSSRGPGLPQMPPFASNVIDPEAVANLAAWIETLPDDVVSQ